MSKILTKKQQFSYFLYLTTLKTIALLPLGILYSFSGAVAVVVRKILKYRLKTVRKNLKNAFPQYNEQELLRIERQFYRHLTDIMVETIKLFHISDKQLRKRVKVTGFELINTATDNGQSTVMYLAHFGNWEWVQEMSNYFSDKAISGSIFHILKSPVWDNIFYKMRSRWNLLLLPQPEVVKTLLQYHHNRIPWVMGFIADQRPGHGDFKHWTTFMHQDTPYVNGPEVIGKRIGAQFVYLDVAMPRKGYYEFNLRPLKPLDDGEPYPVSRAYLKELEETIRKQPHLYLWSHNRWSLKRQQVHG